MTFAYEAREGAPKVVDSLGWRPGTRTRPWPNPKPLAGFKYQTLELVVQARGDADLMASAPRRRSGAAVIGEHGVRAVVAIRGHAASAGADVVVSIAVIDGVRRIQIPVQALVEAVLPRDRVHIRMVVGGVRVVVVLPARVARRLTRMPPAYAEIVLGREILRCREPQT